ncbi:hypothetical protein RHS01_06448 [Rhizoctonia solani]|uniref:Uncharacterized protein n=1 Tax=Rhizoctonia solani TaxID=456999 RepID=A0A8H7IA23_9AGAM|nr:hypothetical protein RHS01_06448 [Rhizoctonia solani]
MAAADPRAHPTGLALRRLERWEFRRQDDPAATATTPPAGGGGGAAHTSAAPETTPTTSQAPPPTTTTTPTRPTQPTTTSNPAQPTTPTTAPTSAAPVPTTPTTTTQQQQPQTSPTQNQSQNQNQNQNQTPTTTQAPATTAQPSTTVIESTPPPTTSCRQSHKGRHATADPSESGSKGMTQSTVIGLAVTGSIAGLLVILLIVWKLTNKRFADLEDTGDDDAIKWPELHKDSAAMTPIPARPSTRATGATETTSAPTLTPSRVHSTTDLAYPPYSDDPGYGTRPAYYDPYGGAQYYDVPRGPSPGPNAIARGMSPGPNMAYATDPIGRGASPAPPVMAYADPVGRTGSPGPGAYGYGAAAAAGAYAQPDPYGGRHSPGPNMAYGQADIDPYGRRSPGPGVAYNNSIGRVASPGPNAGYR